MVFVYFFLKGKERTDTSQLGIENTLWIWILPQAVRLSKDVNVEFAHQDQNSYKTLPAAVFMAPGFVSESEEYVPAL